MQKGQTIFKLISDIFVKISLNRKVEVSDNYFRVRIYFIWHIAKEDNYVFNKSISKSWVSVLFLLPVLLKAYSEGKEKPSKSRGLLGKMTTQRRKGSEAVWPAKVWVGKPLLGWCVCFKRSNWKFSWQCWFTIYLLRAAQKVMFPLGLICQNRCFSMNSCFIYIPFI